MTVCDATEADLPDLLSIYNDVIRTSPAVYTEEEVTLENRRHWLSEHRRKSYPVLVYRDASGVIAGYAAFGDFRPWPGYRHTVEHSLYIRADQRRRGIGMIMLHALIDRARRLDKHVMVGGIDAGNAASIALHERAGFEKIGIMKEVGIKFGGWLDLMWMQRIL